MSVLRSLMRQLSDGLSMFQKQCARSCNGGSMVTHSVSGMEPSTLLHNPIIIIIINPQMDVHTALSPIEREDDAVGERHNLGLRVATLQQGDHFGELALFGARGRRMSSVSVSGATAFADMITIERRAYNKSLKQHLKRQVYEKVSFFSTVDIFRDIIPQTRLLRLAYKSDWCRINFNKALVRRGDPTTHIYLITEGSFKVLVRPIRPDDPGTATKGGAAASGALHQKIFQGGTPISTSATSTTRSILDARRVLANNNNINSSSIRRGHGSGNTFNNGVRPRVYAPQLQLAILGKGSVIGLVRLIDSRWMAMMMIGS